MTADLPLRLGEIGAVLASRMPGVLDATLVLLESVSPALDAAGSGRYEIQRQVGLGGNAEVLLGIARGADGFERPVAIKRVRADLADPGKLEVVLIEEALNAARLSHPNVVSVLDLARDAERRPYLVMEHVDGVDLAALVETGPLPHSIVIFIVRELLAGLGYIHEARDQGGRLEPGLVHRDVKPSNVLISWEGAVKLADFGLARMVERTLPAGAHAREGTPGYLSPEQARREDLDRRSDLYAVGIVLWELLALRRLRAGLPGDSSATITFSAIRRPSEHRPVPADLEAVAMRLLAHERGKRYPIAELAARDLVRCQDASRDGRGDLVRLLDERFPRSRRQGPFPRLLEPGSPVTALRTVTDAWPMDAFAPPPEGHRQHVGPIPPAGEKSARVHRPSAPARNDDRAPRVAETVAAMTSAATDTTNADPAAAGWAIDDPVIRLRLLGSERVFDLATSDRWLLGSSPRCSLRLDDPSGRVSRRHAVASRAGELWALADAGSTNGLRVNHERRRSVELAPGDEVALGGITLIAESARSMELHELLRRWLGRSASHLGEVDRALRDVRAMANLQTALILRGAGGLLGVARRLHQITLGDRPFVALGRREDRKQCLDRALDGMLYVDPRGLGGGLGAVLADLRAFDRGIRLVMRADSTKSIAKLAVLLPRIATISIPPMTEREDELEELLEAYGSDAVAELGASWLGFRPGDPDRVLAVRITTLDEIEDAARRLVALRNWGVTNGANRLGISHAALSRWARRRKISM